MIKNKQILSAVLIFNIAFLSAQPAYAGAPQVVTDESVYINLDYYGKIINSSVVKAAEVNGNTSIVDYGDYTQVNNMTNYIEPTLSDGSVKWELPDYTGRFYYECKPKEVKLPWDFDITYKLNGVQTAAEKLAGASGTVEIDIKATPNSDVSQYYKNNLLLTVTSAFDMSENLSVEAPGAQVQTVGTYKTVIFAGLPQEEEEFVIRVGTNKFETEGIVISMIPGTLSQFQNIKDIKEAKDKVSDSADAIDESLDDLLDTINSMNDGLIATKDGLSDLNGGRKIISDSREELHSDARKSVDELGGVSEETQKVSAHLEDGIQFVEDMNEDINNVVDTTKKIKTIIPKVKTNITDIQANVTELQKMLTDMEALADGRKKSFADLKSSLNNLKDNLSSLSINSNELKDNLDDLKTSIDATQDISWRTEDMVNSLGNSVYYLAPSEALSVLGPSLSTVQTQIGEIDRILSDVIEYINPTISSTQDLLRDISSASKNGRNLTDSLAKITDTIDEYMTLMEDNLDNTNEIMEKTNDLGSSLNETLDISNTLIDNLTALNDTLNIYEPKAVNALNDSKNLADKLAGCTESTYAFLDKLENVLNDSGDSIDEGTRKSLEGLIELLQKSTEGLKTTKSIKEAKDTMGDAIRDEWDELEEDSNVLNLDLDSKPVSFTSASNPSPSSLQILIRTQEITLDDDEDLKDLEPETTNAGVFANILNIFAKMLEAIKSIFK